jgi:2-methylcitrate dehydratase PrpD
MSDEPAHLFAENSRGATERMAHYICATRYDDHPRDVGDKVKLLILDTLGCSIGGLRGPAPEIILDYFRSIGGTAEATVLATGEKLPCANAAYVNAFIGNILDYDDTYRDLAHPGVTTILPALAIAERLGQISGRDFINAVIVGYEVSLRIALAIAPSRRRYNQVFGFTTHQVFGGSAATAKLLGLNEDGVRRALGLAGVGAPVPHIHKNGIARDERPLTWQKGYGTSATVGLTSGLLAAAGMQANRSILDGPNGFWVMAGSDRCQWDLLTHGLGDVYELHHSAIKPWPACRLIHPTLDAAEMLRNRGLRTDDIKQVEVHTLTELQRDFTVHNPRHLPDANFSLPFLVALVLLGRDLRGGLRESDLYDEEVLALAERVVVRADEKADAAQHSWRRAMISTVTLKGRNGIEESCVVENPKGAPENPIMASEVLAKFRALVAPVLGGSRCESLIAGMLGLETIKDVSEICRHAHDRENRDGRQRISA